MALANGHIIRLDLDRPADLEDIPVVPKKAEDIYKIHLDPTGNHLLISMVNEDVYYLHSSQNKPRQVSHKIRGALISAVAWVSSDHLIPKDNYGSSSTSTGDILLGTTQGRILHTHIEATGQNVMANFVGQSIQLKMTQLYQIADSARSPITGLTYERFPGDSAPGDSGPKFFIMAVTHCQLYQFIGTKTFEGVFANYELNPGFKEIRGSLPDFVSNSLSLYRRYSEGMPESFAWLTGPGIYYGNLVFGNQAPGDEVTTETSLVEYSEVKLPGEKEGIIPKALCLTAFHFLFLTGGRFQAINKLTKETVFVYEFNTRVGELLGLAHDYLKGTLWVYSDKAVFEVIVNKEDRNVWELYLRQGQFQLAAQYSREPAQRDKVFAAQADAYYKGGKKDLAAQYYAKTSRPFEEVALKFISERDSLITYLQHKLENIPARHDTQRTAICTWMTEIGLNKLNDLKDQVRKNPAKQKALDFFRAEFQSFLEENQKNLNKATTYNLINSSGCTEEMLFYAEKIQDYERVLSYHIQRADYLRALKALKQLPGIDQQHIFYKFLPILIRYVPYETVNLMMSLNFLDPAKLIPTLMHYDPSTIPQRSDVAREELQHQGLRYLQFVVFNKGNRDPAVHNYLISLYAEARDDEMLVKFIQRDDGFYDQKYALRLATEHKKNRACVLLYVKNNIPKTASLTAGRMGLYEEAVEAALGVDIELAKTYADKPVGDDELRKKLWLRIAQKVISGQQDIKMAMDFLKASGDTLKIEDILPFFPGFVRIGDFKAEITESLKEYNSHINHLKVEMDEATKSASLIREDIHELRNKYGFLRQNQKCDLCGYPVISRQLYLFPCQHVFHSDCLLADAVKNMKGAERQILQDLNGRLQALQRADEATLAASAKAAQIDKVRSEIDDLVASDCPLCGDIMIKSVGKPFISPDESTIISSWAL